MPVHDRVKGFIRQQVHDGVTNVAEVARHTESFVKHQLFPDQPLPSRLNRRYYPTRRDLTNLIYRERIALMHSTIDQQNLMEKIELWSGGSDGFLFRPYSDSDSSASFGNDVDGDDEVAVYSGGTRGLLLVHQTDWQKRLLQRYGCMCLIDATYKTTRYAVPLFFLSVRTNVDYVVVGTFVTQYEDSASIAERYKCCVTGIQRGRQSPSWWISVSPKSWRYNKSLLVDVNVTDLAHAACVARVVYVVLAAISSSFYLLFKINL